MMSQIAETVDVRIDHAFRNFYRLDAEVTLRGAPQRSFRSDSRVISRLPDDLKRELLSHKVPRAVAVELGHIAGDKALLYTVAPMVIRRVMSVRQTRRFIAEQRQQLISSGSAVL